MVSNRRVLFLYKLEINRIERIYRFKRGNVVIIVPEALDCHYSNNVQQPTLNTIYLHIQQSMSVRYIIPE